MPTLLSLVVVGLGLCYVVYQRYLHPLAGIPGPFAASISRLWITRLSWVGGTHKVMVDLHRQHGKYVRIGPNEVYDLDWSNSPYTELTKHCRSVADPAAVKRIYCKN